jgi:hypothetical protein
MVFKEAKSLARSLPPLTKKSEVLEWMKPVWARQALDAFLHECYKVPLRCPVAATRLAPLTRVAVARPRAVARQRRRPLLLAQHARSAPAAAAVVVS